MAEVLEIIVGQNGEIPKKGKGKDCPIGDNGGNQPQPLPLARRTSRPVYWCPYLEYVGLQFAMENIGCIIA